MKLPRKSYNPKAPHRRVQLASVVSQRDAFAERLRQLGAADDVVASVLENWDDPDWVERDQVVSLSDDALRAELEAIEREYHEGTHDEADDAAAARSEVEQQAEGIIDEPWQVVVAWVRDDTDPPARASAIEVLEAQRPKPRPSVLDACSEAIDGE